MAASKNSNKTVPTSADVMAFINAVPDTQKQQDCLTVLEMMREVTGEEPQMWGSSIVGFGAYHYKYASGREGDAPLTGFSPRKQALTLYINAGFDQYGDLMARLGKVGTGASCLYIKRLADVDQTVLRELVKKSYDHMKQAYS